MGLVHKGQSWKSNTGLTKSKANTFDWSTTLHVRC